MIKFSKEKVLLLYKLIVEEIGGTVGLYVATGTIGYNPLPMLSSIKLNTEEA